MSSVLEHAHGMIARLRGRHQEKAAVAPTPRQSSAKLAVVQGWKASDSLVGNIEGGIELIATTAQPVSKRKLQAVPFGNNSRFSKYYLEKLANMP
jgi:hypothetical protein